MPFTERNAAPKPKKTRKATVQVASDSSGVFDKPSEKTNAKQKNSAAAKPVEKSDARIQMERECFNQLAAYRTSIMHKYDLDAVSVASTAVLWRLVCAPDLFPGCSAPHEDQGCSGVSV